eukprot:2875641-Ditylum_brightwellii.AAC.1
MMRSKKGGFTKLVWAPWYDESDTNPIAYTAPNEMQKLVAKLNWYNAQELLNEAFFNCMKKGKNIKQRKTKIRLLYNGIPEGREEIKKQLQLEMR